MIKKSLAGFLLCALTTPLFAAESGITSCGDNREAQALAKLILSDKGQRRTELKCNPLLAKVAQQKAELMMQENRVAHLGADKIGPNYRLILAGYPLPPHYPKYMSNQVEAISGGLGTPERAWKAFKKSDEHRKHLLGEIPIYLEQNEMGVGYVKNSQSEHVNYWVVYVARKARDDDPQVACTPPPGGCIRLSIPKPIIKIDKEAIIKQESSLPPEMEITGL